MKYLLRRSVLFAAIFTAALTAAFAAALMVASPAEANGGHHFEKAYCVGGKTIEPETWFGKWFFFWAAKNGGFWKWNGEEYEFVKVTKGACPAESVYVPAPTRAGYCSVAGNTYPNGTAIPAGTFLDLEIRQVADDPNYEGAVPAIYIEGKGITCDPPPTGFSFDGSTFVDPMGDANGTDGAIYPFYKLG